MTRQGNNVPYCTRCDRMNHSDENCRAAPGQGQGNYQQNRPGQQQQNRPYGRQYQQGQGMQQGRPYGDQYRQNQQAPQLNDQQRRENQGNRWVPPQERQERNNQAQNWRGQPRQQNYNAGAGEPRPRYVRMINEHEDSSNTPAQPEAPALELEKLLNDFEDPSVDMGDKGSNL